MHYFHHSIGHGGGLLLAVFVIALVIALARHSKGGDL